MQVLNGTVPFPPVWKFRKEKNLRPTSPRSLPASPAMQPTSLYLPNTRSEALPPAQCNKHDCLGASLQATSRMSARTVPIVSPRALTPLLFEPRILHIRVEPSLLLLADDAQGLVAAAGGLGVLAAHTDAPEVADTAVRADLLEPLQGVTQVAVDARRGGLQVGSNRGSQSPRSPAARRSEEAAGDGPLPGTSCRPCTPSGRSGSTGGSCRPRGWSRSPSGAPAPRP